MIPGQETAMGGAQIGFRSTLWTLIRKTQSVGSEDSRAALEQLISLYWKPVYFFIRRKGNGIEAAKDLTQGFFASFLEKGWAAQADPDRGRFRTFLLAAVEHYLSDEYDRRTAKKRTPSFDYERAEDEYRPDRTFERDWAMAVLERAQIRLKNENPREATVVQSVRGTKVPYAELALRLNTTEQNVKVLAHRGRQRLKDFLLEELRSTVEGEEEAEDELNDLFRALSL